MKRINKQLCIPIVAACVLYGGGGARADAVTDWNEIMQATVSTPPTNPFFQARWGAIVQLAVFEAVNAIAGRYESYTGLPRTPAGTSMKAAIAQAAHDTLVALFASQTPSFDARLEEDLATIRDARARGNGTDLGR